jgi:carbon-monoxide dehydrogenase large subunit
MTEKYGISHPVRRREDIRFVTGRGRYSDDVDMPGQAHAAFLRSDYPHGELRSVDIGKAAAMPGVTGVFTGRRPGIDGALSV